MARHFCRSRLFRSTSNLLLFFSGLIFGICIQHLLKDTGGGLVYHMSFVEQTGKKMKTAILESVVQKVRNDSSHTVTDAANVGIFRYKSRNPRLLVVVMSTPSHFKTRQIIRQTWALKKPSNTLVYFAVGIDNLSSSIINKIQEENKINGDLMLLDQFKESYNTLTFKVLATLKWSDENLRTEYYMKVDEDSFVRLNEVVKELDSKPTELLYWGFFSGAAKIQMYGKWAELHYFLCDHYLPYAVGGGYVISGDLVRYLAENAEKLHVFNNEDVSVGTWLAPLKINRIHDPNFNTEAISRGCLNSYIVSHPHTLFELVGLNRSLSLTGKLCLKEWRYYNSYIYNWKVPPYYCCDRSDSSIP